ncbi:MAG TPA: hypothetical protein VFO79_07705 [Xanthomonadales bacterium]|nr:hypothetical protein [Xanthomonadales bacterium]
MTRTIHAIAAGLLALALPAAAQHGPGRAPASGPAAEARQFDFLVGDWTLEVKPKVGSLAAMIHGAPRLVGSWSARRALDGHGIEDTLRIVDASGNPSTLNRALRIWSPGERRWLVSSVDVYRARVVAATAQWRDGEMHVASSGTDAEGKPFQTRTRFHAITKDAFRMTQDRSHDAGASWDEAVLVIEATRAAPAPAG